jgi:CRISPR/Cas system-associated exonuclease Cas4 (RecB family)
MLPDATTMPGEILSPSQASTFLGCSAKYRFKYVLGLPDPAGGGAVRGRAVHKEIEYYMRAKMADLALDGEAITDEWDKIWDDACEGAEFAAHEDVEALKASGAQLVDKYLCEAAPKIQPLAVEVPVSGEIAGVKVRGIIDILDAEGRIDIKTASRKPSKISGDHAFQLATYTALLDHSVSGETRIDSLVSTKDPQLVQIEHTPGESGKKLVERMYPLVADGLFISNRAGTLCGYCPYARVRSRIRRRGLRSRRAERKGWQDQYARQS